jgi:phage shock protein PspC (stress-responsive transcriptional regulator)
MLYFIFEDDELISSAPTTGIAINASVVTFFSLLVIFSEIIFLVKMYYLLVKRSKNGKIGGVCAGIAEWYRWNPRVVRIVSIFISGIIIYILFWIIMPPPDDESKIVIK